MASRFAKSEDIFSPSFSAINKRLLEINEANELVDHNEINKQRFSQWYGQVSCTRSFYGSRFWEYPFAIEAAELQTNMRCADIGCGTTPFTPYLCEAVGKQNVIGIDPDYVAEDLDTRHLSFGARRSHIEKFGFGFKQNDFTKIDIEDNFFDRVFCISVLEHIDDMKIKQRGLQEMARILKPGGKLIITFDTGIDVPLNPPLKIMEMSGLIPDPSLNLQWPEKRFVNYGDSCIDVFGLVLCKPEGVINRDYNQTEKIEAYRAQDRYVSFANWFNISYNSVLMLKDMERPFGTLRVAVKKLLKRY